VQFNSEVKQVLDSWARQEAAVREAEQKKLVEFVLGSVQAKLSDPKMVFPSFT
jgi:hypothetical protein